ncbi:hypothetical protein C0991_002443 [Blastosporella zonata]|nr:hypothetical protein C0991_002443 [Blastosporella zonata]
MALSVTETFPHQWKYVSEGGATIVFSYIGPPNPRFDGVVLRLRKAALPSVPSLQEGIQDEPDDPLIEFQQKCMARLIPSEHLPRLESVHTTRDWLESLVILHDPERPPERRAKDQVDVSRRKGVLATDLVGGNWLAVEIKMKSKTGEAVSLGFCPLDLFSGDKDRMLKAIYDLWDAWSNNNGMANNLKIFVHGSKISPSEANPMLSDNAETSHSELREAFARALLPLLLETPVLHIISTLQRSLDSLDIEGLSKLWRLAESAQGRSNGMYDAPPSHIGASSAYLDSTEPTITDWTKFVDVYLSSSACLDHSSPLPENLRFYLLAYLLSATFKDCSIIVRLDNLRPTGPAKKVKPEQVTIIDLDPKSMARLQKWEKLDREIVEAYIAGSGRKVCVDALR